MIPTSFWAYRELQEALHALNHDIIERVLLQAGILWGFLQVHTMVCGNGWSTWWVRVLSSVLHCRSWTIDFIGFSEMEAILNDRLITKLSDDPIDLEPLTPNHLCQLECLSLMTSMWEDNGDMCNTYLVISRRDGYGSNYPYAKTSKSGTRRKGVWLLETSLSWNHGFSSSGSWPIGKFWRFFQIRTGLCVLWGYRPNQHHWKASDKTLSTT